MKLTITKKTFAVLLAMTMGSGVAGAVSVYSPLQMAAVAALNAVTEVDDANEVAYQRLKAQLEELKDTYETTWNEFLAVAPLMDSGWQRTYGNQLGGIQGAIGSMSSWLESQYASGALTEESILENYDNIQGQLSQLQSTMEQTIMGQLRGILQDLNATVGATMGSEIGSLQNKLNELGVAQQYEDRVNALMTKKSEAQTKLDEAMAAIGTSASYAERMKIAVEARTYIYGVRDEIQAECKAILSEVIYNNLMAQVDELQTTYNTVWEEFMSLAPVMDQGWLRSYGNQLQGGIYGAIVGMRGAINQQYQAGTLTEDYVIENYEDIKGQLSQLQSTMEQTIMGQLRSILQDLNATVGTTMGSAIANLQNKLNELGVAQQYEDRVNALITKKSEAQTKLDEAMAAIGTSTSYAERMNKAVEARTYIYGVRDEILAECEAILNELATPTGINSVKYADSFANGQVYDMNGRRVTAPSKGMFIVNGKKVVIK